MYGMKRNKHISLFTGIQVIYIYNQPQKKKELHI